MSDERKIQVLLLATLLVAAVLGSAETSTAMEVKFRTENMMMGSDNINRAPKGQEKNGYRLTMEGGLSFSGAIGRGTAELDVGGGWETIDDGNASDSNSSRFSVNLELPWSQTGYVRAGANSSDAIEDPNITDVNQERVRTRRTGKRIEVGKKSSASLSWDAALTNRTEKRFDRDLDESEMTIGWNAGVSPRKTLLVDLGVIDGSEDIAGDSWNGYTASLDLQTRRSNITSTGWRLNWQGQKIKKEDGTNDQAGKLGVALYYETQTPSRWSFSSEMGADGIKPPSDERRWEPRARLSIQSRPERTFKMKGDLSTSAVIQDPTEEEIAWTRETQMGMTGTWTVTRNYTVEPGVRLRRAELFGNTVADRTDEAVVFQVATKWSPERDWSVQFNIRKEKRDSSQAAFDLVENRLELIFRGLFF